MARSTTHAQLGASVDTDIGDNPDSGLGHPLHSASLDEARPNTPSNDSDSASTLRPQSRVPAESIPSPAHPVVDDTLPADHIRHAQGSPPDETRSPTPSNSTQSPESSSPKIQSPRKRRDASYPCSRPTFSHSRGRSSTRGATNNYFQRLLDALDNYELFVAASASHIEKLDPCSYPKNLRKEKRTFILRSMTEQGKRKTEDIRSPGPRFAGPGGSSADRYDYEQRYPADEPGQAYGRNARIWRVYNDEATNYDVDMVDTIKDTIDVILVFAGLFSAIVSTLVSQVSTALKLDYVQVTAALMTELIAVQRAMANGTPVDQVKPSTLTTESSPSATSSNTDRWANGLWFTSLAFSLSTALIAVLVKQWIQAYNTPSFQGSARDHGRIRQFRYMGLEKWHVPLIVGLLPTLLHLSLLLFFMGLVVLLRSLDRTIAWIVTIIAVVAYSAYAVANILPIWDSQCPYKTPLSQFAFIIKTRLVLSVKRVLVLLGESRLRRLPGLAQGASWTSADVRTSGRSSAQFTPRTLKDAETHIVQTLGGDLDAHMVHWLHQTSSRPSVQSIITCAMAELPPIISSSERAILRQNVSQAICAQVESVYESWEATGKPSFRLDHRSEQKLMGAHLRIAEESSPGSYGSPSYHHAYGHCHKNLLSMLKSEAGNDSTLALMRYLHEETMGQPSNPTNLARMRRSAVPMNLWIPLLQRQAAEASLFFFHVRPFEKFYNFEWHTLTPDSVDLDEHALHELLGIFFTDQMPSHHDKPHQSLAHVEKFLLSTYLRCWAYPEQPFTKNAALSNAFFTGGAPPPWDPSIVALFDSAAQQNLGEFCAHLMYKAAETAEDFLSLARKLLPMQQALSSMDWDSRNLEIGGIHNLERLASLLPSAELLQDLGPRVYISDDSTNGGAMDEDSVSELLYAVQILHILISSQTSSILCDSFKDKHTIGFLRYTQKYTHRITYDRHDEQLHELMFQIISCYIQSFNSIHHNPSEWRHQHFQYVLSELSFILTVFADQAMKRQLGRHAYDWGEFRIDPTIEALLKILVQHSHSKKWDEVIAGLRLVGPLHGRAYRQGTLNEFLLFLDEVELHLRFARRRKSSRAILDMVAGPELQVPQESGSIASAPIDSEVGDALSSESGGATVGSGFSIMTRIQQLQLQVADFRMSRRPLGLDLPYNGAVEDLELDSGLYCSQILPSTATPVRVPKQDQGDSPALDSGMSQEPDSDDTATMV